MAMSKIRGQAEQLCIREAGELVLVRDCFRTLTVYAQGLEKKIPGAPENEVQVHLRKRQIFADSIRDQIPWPEAVEKARDEIDFGKAQ